MKQKSNNYARKIYKKELPQKVNTFIGIGGVLLIRHYIAFHDGIIIEDLPAIQYIFDDSVIKIDVKDDIIKSATQLFADESNKAMFEKQLSMELINKELFLDFAKNYFDDSIKKVSVIQKESLPL